MQSFHFLRLYDQNRKTVSYRAQIFAVPIGTAKIARIDFRKKNIRVDRRLSNRHPEELK